MSDREKCNRCGTKVVCVDRYCGPCWRLYALERETAK